MYVSQAEEIFATHSNYTTHSLDSAAPKERIPVGTIVPSPHRSSVAMSAAPTAVTT